MAFEIVLLPGDGIGTEVMAEGVKVLREVESRLVDVEFKLTERAAGAAEQRSADAALAQARRILDVLEDDPAAGPASPALL